MTATIATGADLDGVVRRADARWASRNGDEPAAPEYLKAIVSAVRPLLGQAPAGPVDDVQVKQLLADKQRLQDLVDELRKHVDARDRSFDRQKQAFEAVKGDLAQLKTERDEARAERDTARAQLRDRPAADTVRQQLVVAAADVTVKEKLATAAADVERLTGEVARLTEQLALREVPEHSCLYPIAEPGAEPGPCGVCQRPYPRSADAYELEDDIPPTVEPWAELFGQIRDEAKKAGWKA